MQVQGQRDRSAAECDQAGEGEQRAGGEPGPGDGAGDEGDAEADRQAREREQAKEAGADERPNEQALQDPGRCAR